MSQQRITRLKKILKTENLDALLVNRPEHVRYLTGFTGSNSLLVVEQRRAHFFTDSRYTVQAKKQVKGATVNVLARPLAQGLTEIPSVQKRFTTVGFECDYTTISQRQEFANGLNGALLAATRGIVESIAVVKEQSEIKLIEEAVAITDSAFADVLEFIKPGVRERELAAELEYRMKKLGASGPAFETIVASGARSALPHGVASEKKVAKGDYITFDFGAMYKGYCADMTRTVVVGKASARQKKIYDLVLRSQKAGIAKIKSGRSAADVDRAARTVIARAGYGKRFSHSLGHGIGFYVHVEPRLAATSKDVLRRGMVVTVEPGVYFEGWGGVRIEDDVVVTSSGSRVLNKSPKNLLEL